MIKPIDPSIDQIGVAVCCSARFLIFFPVYCLMCPPVWSSIGGRSFVRLFVGSFVGLIVGSLARWLVRSRKKKKKCDSRARAISREAEGRGGEGNERKGRRKANVRCILYGSVFLASSPGGLRRRKCQWRRKFGGEGGEGVPVQRRLRTFCYSSPKIALP